MAAIRNKFFLFVLLGAAAALGASARAEEAFDFSGVETVVFQDVIATVDINIRPRGKVDIAKTDGAEASYPISIEVENSVLTISGEESPHKMKWRRKVRWRKYHKDAFEVFLEDYPKLALNVPKGVDLSFDGAVVMVDAGDTEGALYVGGGHVDGRIGDVDAADVNIHGAGDLKVGDVAGALNISIHGSGDFAAGRAGAVTADIHGSGDISFGEAAGDVIARIHGSGDMDFKTVNGSAMLDSYGSGDIEAGDVAGEVDINIMGSSDISLAKVGGGARITLKGSGDVDLARIAGRADVTINGSGDVYIGDGRADELRVRTSGSGDFNFLGLAVDPDIVASGSSSVYIRRHEGSVRARGRGDIQVGAISYSDED